jgi:hypothetical protein
VYFLALFTVRTGRNASSARRMRLLNRTFLLFEWLLGLLVSGILDESCCTNRLRNPDVATIGIFVTSRHVPPYTMAQTQLVVFDFDW